MVLSLNINLGYGKYNLLERCFFGLEKQNIICGDQKPLKKNGAAPKSYMSRTIKK